MLNLVNYIGIDIIDGVTPIHNCTHNIQGHISLEEDIHELLSFTICDKNTNHKCIEFFHDSNFEGESYEGNLIIVDNSFQLGFEYSSFSSPSKIQVVNKNLYSTINTSINSYDIENLDSRIYICDLFCSLVNSTTIFYNINTVICFNYL